MHRTLAITGLLIGMTAVTAPLLAADPAPSPALVAATKADTRSPKTMARDPYRHPAQTLAFFGVKPTDTVVEIWPSGGWYTEILAPYLAAKGSLYPLLHKAG